MGNNLKEIKEFINQWKERASNYIPQAIAEYKAKREEIYNTFDFYNQYEERKNKLRELNEEYPQYIRELASGYSPKDQEERIKKLINDEAEFKEKKLIARVNKAVGEIVKPLGLKISCNGELNGSIQGTQGICNIETIYAGGYNIQCLHFRVLVKKVSA